MKRKYVKTGVTVMPLAAVLIIFFMAGCEGKKPATEVKDSTALEDLKVLKIPATDWSYIAGEKGWLKEAFEDKGIKVELVEGVTGNEVPLFGRDDLHFASRMLYPYLLYRSQGADLISVQVSTHPLPEVASIMVKAESPYRTVDDLRGKKVASWRAGCPYMVLYEIMEKKGWKEGQDWTYVNIRTANDALLAGEIDALSAHPLDNVAALLTTGTAREIAYPAADSVYVNGGGVTVNFTTSSFAKNYPNIVRKYIEVQEFALEWMLSNAEEGTGILEWITRAPAHVSELAWSRRTGNWKSERDLAKILVETEVMQNWLVEHGDLDAAKVVEVSKLFDPQFFN
jgi:ABC-type nitrate/sulfonate/bicarbonate transport system substrate-binding protein